MPNQLLFLVSGALLIVLLGRWSKQNRTTVLVLCCAWGGFVSSLH